MTNVIVLAMHGAPPNDFPRDEAREYFNLHAHHGHAHGHDHGNAEGRFAELEKRMRDWPRTSENDPFHAGSQALAEELRRATGLQVLLGFNEFCAPSVGDALDRAAALGAGRVIIVTPMMTAGGEHSEVDIPATIGRAAKRHPGVEFVYAWPFEVKETAAFLAAHIGRLL